MSQAFDPMRSILRALGRLLYYWTRPQVFVGRSGEFNLDPTRPVCYVLAQSHLSNVLVLNHECEVRNLPPALAALRTRSLRHPRSWFSTQDPRASANRPALLERLVAVAMTDPLFDVQLVPVTILWGRAPGKQDSVLKALFAETWQVTSSLRQWFRVVIHGYQTEVHFHQAGSLRQLLRGDPDVGHATRRLERIFRLYFYRERTRAIGPDLSHRNTQLRAVLAAREVREAVAAQALAQNISFARAEATARRYALEIASDYSYTITQAFMLFIDWATRNVFDGVDVFNAEKLHGLPNNATLIYVPCHRSYVDAVLLNHFLYRNGITCPSAVAGANLNVPIVGNIFRGLGAFFLRRKIKGNPLYAAVFNRYFHQVVDHGVPIQYYIEGGRSRSGCLLMPKTGMLGMTVHSYLRSRSRPMYFVPVYFGYEKLMEGSSYLAEYGGQAKKSESLLGMLGAIGTLGRQYGRVSMNFGEPLRLSTFLDEQLDQATPWREVAPAEVDAKAPWLRQAVATTGIELARRINAAVIVHPVSLLALTVLATPKRCADMRDIERQIEHLQYLSAHCGWPAGAVCTQATPAVIIERGLGQGLISLRAHPLGDLVTAAPTPEQAGALAYPRNNVIHLFAMPSLMACLVNHNLILSRARAREAIKGIYTLLQAELFLPWAINELDAVIDQTEQSLLARGLIQIDEVSGLLRAPMPQSDASSDLAQLVEILRANLERLFLTLDLLQHYGSACIRREAFEDSGHLLLQRLSDLYVFNTPDFAEKVLFAASVRNLIDQDFLHLNDQGLLCFDERISLPAAQAELLLATDVRHNIQRLAATTGQPAELSAEIQKNP